MVSFWAKCDAFGPQLFRFCCTQKVAGLTPPPCRFLDGARGIATHGAVLLLGTRFTTRGSCLGPLGAPGLTTGSDVLQSVRADAATALFFAFNPSGLRPQLRRFSVSRSQQAVKFWSVSGISCPSLVPFVLFSMAWRPKSVSFLSDEPEPGPHLTLKHRL